MSDTTYTLWCFAEGTKHPFSITPSSTIFIDELKKLIKEEELPNFLQGIDASSLTLWKVRHF